MAVETGAAKLTEAQVETYHRDGLAIPDYRLPPDLLTRMRVALDSLVAENPGVTRDAMFCPHIKNGGCQGLKGSDDWLEFARIPEILDMVAQVIGPDLLLWGTTVFGKPPRSGKTVPWHQDGEYWPISPLATCTVWIALDDATPENGCLRYIPGSHRRKSVYSHHQDNSESLALNMVLDDDQLDEGGARDVLLEAGQISLHDVYLVHGSEPNHSDQRRAGFVCRYMPTTSHFDHVYGLELQRRSGTVDFGQRALWLVRGTDRCGKNDFSIGHEFA